MNYLKDLEGVSKKEIPCEFIKKPSAIRKLLKSGKAATIADTNGAINIWRDDEGFIRCNVMAWMISIEKKKYKTFKDAEKWISKWQKKIK